MVAASMIGVAISLVANLLINVGLNVQKLAHAETFSRRADATDECTAAEASASTFCSLRWLSGLVIQLSGESGNMVAYSFAATSIIAPLGAVGLLANIYIATCFLGEPFRSRDVVGSLLAGGGAALIAVWAPSNTLQMTSEQMLHGVILQYRSLYLAGVMVMGGVLYVVEQFKRARPATTRFLGISAAFATFTIFAIKGVSLMLRDAIAQQQFSHLKTPVFMALVPVALISGPGQIYWLNKALAVFPASSVVPTYYVFFSISAILVGGIVFRDFDHMHLMSVGMFALGVCSCMIGVLLINSGRGDDDDGEECGDNHDGVIDKEYECLDDSDVRSDAFSRQTAEGVPLLGNAPPRRLRRMSSVQSFTLSPAVVTARPSRRESGISRNLSRGSSRSNFRELGVQIQRAQSAPVYDPQ